MRASMKRSEAITVYCNRVTRIAMEDSDEEKSVYKRSVLLIQLVKFSLKRSSNLMLEYLATPSFNVEINKIIRLLDLIDAIRLENDNSMFACNPQKIFIKRISS